MEARDAGSTTDFDGAWKEALDEYLELEVQSQPDRRLPERMYRYHHRIADRYDQRVVSLAVLADNSPRFRPGPYEVETLGCRLRFEYPTCKYRLIDWLIQLPEELAIEFRRELIEYEERKHMPYITSIERLGRQEGREEGRRKGLQEGRRAGWREGLIAARQKAVVDALEIRFGPVPDAVRQAIKTIHDEARLRALLQTAIQTVSIKDFAREL